MLTKEYAFIRDSVLNLVECTFAGEISVEEFDGVSVKFDGKDAVIGCKSKSTFARGVFLLTMENKGKPFEISQKPHFEILAAMQDVARNGVFTVDALKKYMLKLAALGYTHIVLYLEDMFELEGYPRFGYMRGRYSVEELREICEYGKSVGVEFMPCVQSLGHMAQYLQWSEALPVKDTGECFLVDAPETYELLEKAYKLMRSLTDCKYIKVCMDETHDLGTGRFESLFGKQPRKEIYLRHAKRVAELCEKYGFTPVIDTDMFWREASKHGWYHDPEVEISEDMLVGFPKNIALDYWDYYQTDKKLYDYYIEQHLKFNRELHVTGSIWTWEGFTEDTVFTWRTSLPMVKSCIEHGTKTFVVSHWNDNGAECNNMHTASSLPIFSEYCYRGAQCPDEVIFAVSEFLTKMPLSHKLELARIHSEYHDCFYIAKKFLYGDIFYNLVNLPVDEEILRRDFTHAMNKAWEYLNLNDRNKDYYELCYYNSKVVYNKFDLTHLVRRAYKAGDKKTLRHIAEVRMPEVIADLKKFTKLFQKDWLGTKKPNGLEVINVRLGGVVAQLQWQAEYLIDYIEGRAEKITMLEEDVIQDSVKTWHMNVFTPSVIKP